MQLLFGVLNIACWAIFQWIMLAVGVFSDATSRLNGR